MTEDEVRAIMQGIRPAIIEAIVGGIKATNAARDARIAALEAKVPALESRALSPEYAGTFEQGKSYRRGGLVTKAGGLWLALTDTTLIPGSNPTAWKLVVKSGGAER